MKITVLLSFKSLVAECWKFNASKVLATLFLALLSSFSSGIGILLIIPLMASIGVDTGGVSAGAGASGAINQAISYLGIPLELAWILGLYVVLIMFMAGIRFLNTVVAVSLRQSFTMHLRSKTTRSLFYTQWRYLNQAHMSDFMRLLVGQIQSASASVKLLLTLMSSVTLIAVYLCFSLFLSVQLTVMALGCGLLLVALLWPVNKLIYKSGSIGLNANKQIYRSIFENVASLKIIKSFAAEERYLAEMNKANTQLEYQSIRAAKINALTSFVNTVGAAIIFAVLFYSAIQVLHLPVSNLLVLLFIFSRLMPQISSIQACLQSLIHQAPSYLDLLDKRAELAQWSEPSQRSLKAPDFQQSLELKQVSFQYAGDLPFVFQDFNVTVLRNQTVAITGPSGVGKSTFADLISGLLEPTQGRILIDGIPIEGGNRSAWREQVAYVTQDVFLFHDSVRENLRWVCPSNKFSSDEEQENALWDVLELAAAADFVRNLPQGLSTLIGDRGVKLSGGERQRLALARALLSAPSVLILDEATSALDRENELKIRDALVNLDGKLTIFIIAHNETTIEHVAQRIVL